ncbi:MAG TPA: hypothetical protein VL171_00865 [Verrucomicrobiae bacterium]|nr:hypothetical protein [Verrucomicrobiae bacterium]
MNFAFWAVTTGCLFQLSTQQTVGSDLLLVLANSFFTEPIGYAWPKTSLLLTNTGPLNLKPLRNGGTYPLLTKLEDGYSIVCEGRDGEKHAALLPARDRLGYPVAVEIAGDEVIVSHPHWILDTLDTVDLKPGVIELKAGKRYAVIKKDNQKLWTEFSSPALTQTVQIAGADAEFLSNAGYKAAIGSTLDDLKNKASQKIEVGHFSAVARVFTGYNGRFAEETADARQKLATEFGSRAAEAQRERELRYEAEQRAKGLVNFRGEWITPEEKTKREQNEQAEAAQPAPAQTRPVEPPERELPWYVRHWFLAILVVLLSPIECIVVVVLVCVMFGVATEYLFPVKRHEKAPVVVPRAGRGSGRVAATLAPPPAPHVENYCADDSGNTAGRSRKISVRQKGVLLFFGRPARGLNRGTASDIITSIFADPANKERWESEKYQDLSDFRGTPLYKFIRRAAGEDWEDFEGETLTDALDRIADYEFVSHEDEIEAAFSVKCPKCRFVFNGIEEVSGLEWVCPKCGHRW